MSREQIHGDQSFHLLIMILKISKIILGRSTTPVSLFLIRSGKFPACLEAVFYILRKLYFEEHSAVHSELIKHSGE